MSAPSPAQSPTQPPVATRLVGWQRQFGRHHLPWQGSNDPYRVWLSEIMLQQTQVSTVLPYFQRFIQRFPNVGALAQVSEDDLMPYWAGLGYYTRARNLLACAKQIVRDHEGRFPMTVEALSALPGIGRSTAGAIVSLALGRVAPILDGNVRRVFARYFGVHGHTALPHVQRQLWVLAQTQLPEEQDIKAYNQGLMDLGATVCTRRSPQCARCPLQVGCVAREQGLTGVLPTPKPPAVRREEHFEVTLHIHADAIWLEQRPKPGVWAGLWMAPMKTVSGQLMQRSPDLIHELTHRRYCLYAQRASSNSPQSMLANGRWEPLPLAADAPVPACLHKLLSQCLAQGSDGVNDPMSD